MMVLLAYSIPCSAQDYLLRTDATWRTIKASQPVGTDWNSAVIYDDSEAAGWTNAFKSPMGDRIWHTSNLSSESPANPRFRHAFDLSGGVTSAVAHFYFDDDATVWINGTEVLNDTDRHATTFDNVILDASLFHEGDNLIAVWGHNVDAPYNNIEVDISLTVVPEPGAIALLVVGAGTLLFMRRVVGGKLTNCHFDRNHHFIGCLRRWRPDE
jgi:hypothetical protein